MESLKNFKTNDVIVRRFEMNDLEDIHYNILIQDDVIDMANYTPHKNIDESRIILKSAINEYYTDEPIWAVEDKKNKNLVGFIRVSKYSRKNKKCHLTWAVAHQYWDSSFMKEALIQTMNFLFSKKDIELIISSYYEQNKISSVILESIGMRKEAVLRERRINEKTNQKENFVIYSINKQEFYEVNCIKNQLAKCQ